MGTHARAAKGMLTACLLLLLMGPACVFAAGTPLQRIDREWRERFVMGYFADIFRHRGQAQKQALAEFEATRQSTDTRARLRAAARHFIAMDDDSGSCQVIDETLREARAAGDVYAAELFDVGFAALMSVSSKPCRHQLTNAELQALAQRLGDPARMYFVLEARVPAATYANRFNELIEIFSSQADYAIADYQRAYTLAYRAQTELNAAADSSSALLPLQQALALSDPGEYATLHLMIQALLHRAAVGAGQDATARAHMQLALPGALQGLLGARDSAFYLILFARFQARHGEPQHALELLEKSRAFDTGIKQVSMSRSRTLLETYAALGTPSALASGLREVQHIEDLLQDTDYFGPQKVKAAKLAISTFLERFGRHEGALAALKDANRAADALQKVANETARVELREKLDIAAKEKENAELRAQAELQAARQRGWIMAFGVATCGVAAAYGALSVAMRRGRRLSKVTAELEQRNAELEQRSASRIRLLAAACHDLRQPAHALGMLAELGSDVQRNAARFSAWLQSVRRSTASLSEMLDELMDLGRLDTGHYTPQLSDVSLLDVLHDVRLHFGGLARRKGLALEVAQAQGHVVSDRHLLRRILFNLVSNAIKYTDTGFVRVDVHPVGNSLQLIVRDSGPGIPPDRLDDVFRDYVRLNPLKAAEGLGIGLAIVRRAADLLGHELELMSSPGEGTAVSLRLPPSHAARAGAAPRETDGKPRTRRGKVALLEDDVDVRDAMAALLRLWGYTVRAASSVPALLAEAPDHPFTPDLLITDLHLAGASGLEAIAQLRAVLHAPDLPALLVTGDLDTAITTQAAIAQAYIAHKPLAPSKLDALVQALISPAASAGQVPRPTPGNTPWAEAYGNPARGQ